MKLLHGSATGEDLRSHSGVEFAQHRHDRFRRHGLAILREADPRLSRARSAAWREAIHLAHLGDVGQRLAHSDRRCGASPVS